MTCAEETSTTTTETTDNTATPLSESLGADTGESKSGGPNTPKQRQWHRRPGQKIDDLLLKRHQRYAPLSRLIDQSEKRKSLTQAVCSLLPDNLANAVSVANFRPPTLVLRVSNASLATRLRYKLPDLTTKLRNLADFQELSKINLRVVQSRASKIVERPPRYLPAAANKSLTELANSLAEHPDYHELESSILRLSEHTQESVTAAPDGSIPEEPEEPEEPEQVG